MIRRLRARAPLVMSVLLIGIGLALGAAAQGTARVTNVSEPVTQREFYSMLALGFVVTVGGCGGVMKFLFSLAVSDYRRVADRMEQAVARFEDRQFGHNADSSAHPAALAPVYARIDRFREEIGVAPEVAVGHRAKRRSTDPRDGGPNDSGPDWTDEMRKERRS
jgi:Na+-transporting methylmalonyl-CoA/oxaloacetate decarboxylase gamma subunit